MIGYSKFQKLLALLFTFTLFFLVGILFFLVSKNNKEKTEILRSIVIEQQKEKAKIERLDNLRSASTTIPVLSSKSYLTLAVSDKGINKIIFAKNVDLPLPIASLTKLMLAIIVIENVDLDMEIVATADSVGLEESYFVLEVGRKYLVRDVLANALIASDNDSARLLANLFAKDDFVAKMNSKAVELGLEKTHYSNVTGLDPVDLSKEPLNTSTAIDLANLLIYIKRAHPEILKITANGSYNFCDTNNRCRIINNTNKILNNSEFPFRLIGGKTGSTDLAGKNLALIFNYFDDVSLINIVIGAQDNFSDTLSIIKNIN